MTPEIKAIVEKLKVEHDERPALKGLLYDESMTDTHVVRDCMCAQGRLLYDNGYSLDQLKELAEVHGDADMAVARALGVSIGEAVFIRSINDICHFNPWDAFLRMSDLVYAHTMSEPERDTDWGVMAASQAYRSLLKGK